MKLSNTFKVTWWILLLLICACILGFRADAIIDGDSTPFDIVVFVVFIALMLAPIFAEIEIFGIRLKKEIEELKNDINLKFGDIKNDIRNQQTQTLHANFHGFGPPAPDNKIPQLEDEIEKILKKKFNNGSVKNNNSIKDLDVPGNPLAMFRVRYNIEFELRRIWLDRFGNGAEINTRRLSITRIIQELQGYGIIDDNMGHILREILAICNYSIHGEDITVYQTDFVSNNAFEIIEVLKRTS